MGCANSSNDKADKKGDRQTKTASPTRKVEVSENEETQARHGLSKYSAPRVVVKPMLAGSRGSAPKARKQHTLSVIDEHSLFFFGGLCSTEEQPSDASAVRQSKEKPAVSNQMFVYTPRDSSWHHPSTGGDQPSARCTHVTVSYDGSLFTYGSHNHKDQTLFQYKAAFKRWIHVQDEGKKPQATAGGSACVAGDLMLLFGGDDGSTVVNDLFAFEFLTSKWYEVEDTRNDITVMGRRDHSAVVFEDKMLVFGGFGRVSDELEFIQFNANSKAWSLVTVADCQLPERRGAHCCALYHHFMFIFGGMHHGKFLNDLHVFNVLTGVWTEVSVEAPSRSLFPCKRGFGGSAICGQYWYVHGGTDDRDLFRDLFSIDANDLTKAADPTFVPPSELAQEDDTKKKKLVPGDEGYNRYNVKYFSPMWNDVITRSSRPVIDM